MSDETLSEKVRGWEHRAREAGEDLAAQEWEWHAKAVEALEAESARLRADVEDERAKKESAIEYGRARREQAEAAESRAAALARRVEALEGALRELKALHTDYSEKGQAAYERARAALSAPDAEGPPRLICCDVSCYIREEHDAHSGMDAKPAPAAEGDKP